MNVSQLIFVQVVTWACTIEDQDTPPTQKEALRKNIEGALYDMAEIQQREGSFDQQEYADRALKAIEVGVNGETILAALSDYCHFQNAVRVLPLFPDLVARLEHYELTSWAKLQVDRHSLQPLVPLALQIIDVAALRNGDFPSDQKDTVARLVRDISAIFGLLPSPRTMDLAKWHINHRAQMQ